MSVEDWLRVALHASSAEAREEAAAAGLRSADRALRDGQACNPDSIAMLHRQRYRAALDRHDLTQALSSAQQAARLGGGHRGMSIRDVAEHDLARVLWALGQTRRAIQSARLAARNAPAPRRCFHLTYLATLQQHAREYDAALATLRRAKRAARPGRTRTWVLAQEALVRLERDEVPEGLPEVVASMRQPRNHAGYGGYLAGMLAHHMGDHATAEVHLGAFLRRHANLERRDPAKALTLAEELARARQALHKRPI